MSNTKKINNNNVSNNRIIIKKYFSFSPTDFQFDIIEIGIINVVKIIKYIDKPSIPK
jgi:hypothetical protein